MSGPKEAGALPVFLRESGSGVIISVHLKPRSKRDMIEGASAEGLLRVRVSEAPVKGAANKGLVRLLSESIGVPRSRVSIISGETSPRKRVLIQDLSVEEAGRWWQEIAKKQKPK